MASQLSWLDSSPVEQQQIRELLGLFREHESRDELGIGQVRDAFGDLLFPGTSTLHTRARYLLIVPWCIRHAARRPGRDRAALLDRTERVVIESLRAAGATDGLIGRRASTGVKTLPSTVYASALGRYGIDGGGELIPVRDARSFSICMHGAALLYNLLLAEQYEQAGHDAIEPPDYRAGLADWAGEMATVGPWDRADMWTRLGGKASSLSAKAFIEAWTGLVLDGRAGMSGRRATQLAATFRSDLIAAGVRS